MDNRLEAVALGLTEIARIYEGGKRVDTKELCAGLRNYAGVVRAVDAAVRTKGADPAMVQALAAAISAVCDVRSSGTTIWADDALKSMTESLVAMLAPPLMAVPAEPERPSDGAGVRLVACPLTSV